MDVIKKTKKGRKDKQQDTDMFLKKHVGLIHCENKLTLIQRKICNILLFNALDKINDQEIHTISLRHLCSLVGYNSNDSKLIKESIKSLISIVMEWNLLEDNTFLQAGDYSQEDITWNASCLLAGATIKNGSIQYSYSPQMRSILSSLDIYGRINLFVQAKFNSTYSLVLYENCVRFKNLSQTCWFSIPLFRSLMGVSDEKYSSFKEFKRNVINVAVKEINQKADICVEPVFKKSGRHIVGVQFKLSENDNYKPSFRKIAHDAKKPQPVQHHTLAQTLVTSFQLSEKQANAIVNDYTSDYILEKIRLVAAKKDIDHPGAYLIAALKKDYKGTNKKSSAAKTKPSQDSCLREAKKASEIVPLRNKYMMYKLSMYKQFIDQQAQEIKSAIKAKFEECLQSNVEVLRFYKRSGLTSPFVMVDFIGFVDKHFPHVLGPYLSFDDYLTSEEI